MQHVEDTEKDYYELLTAGHDTATAKIGLRHLHQLCLTLGLLIASVGPQSSPMSYWLLNNSHEGTVILLSYGPNCEITMLQWVIVYLCPHTVQIKLSTSEPKQKGIHVGKGWLGVPRRE